MGENDTDYSGDPVNAFDLGQSSSMGYLTGPGTTYGADPAGLAGVFSGGPLAADFGEGFFEPGGGYESNINTSAMMTDLQSQLSSNPILAVDPVKRAQAIDMITTGAKQGMTAQSVIDQMTSAGMFHNTMDMMQTKNMLKSYESNPGLWAGIGGGALLGVLTQNPYLAITGGKAASNLAPAGSMSVPDVNYSGGSQPTNTTGADGSQIPTGQATTPGQTGTTGGNMATSNPTSLTDIALDLYRKTDPARAAIIERGMNFLEGDLDYTQSPVWGAGKNAAEVQYRLARDQILGNTPGGGRLVESLADTDTAKARTLTDLASTVGMDEYNKIYGMATGTPQQTISGLSSALGSATQLQGYNIMENIKKDEAKNQMYGDLGQGVGEAWGDK